MQRLPVRRFLFFIMVIKPSTYTVESVTSGHPDKVCDQISDAILDACLAQDPLSRVAVETFGSHGLLVLGGEVSTHAKIDYKAIAAKVYKEIGYMDELEIISRVVEQSPDIAQGVNTGGAGDQGIMYGYATNETREMLPDALVKVHKLTAGLERLRKTGECEWLGPDGKAQITVENNVITKVLVSTQHAEDVTQEQIHRELKEQLIIPIVGDVNEILINPTGVFVQGGFEADAGLTGRKIIVDTYGGLAPHGGGAFSGKDATKVDRSAAYMARYVAKNIVSRGLAKEALISVAYAIGKVEPLMVEVYDEQGTSIKQHAQEFDFRPEAIIERLDLRKPIFKKTAVYGHFGRVGLPWEEVVRKQVLV